MGVIDFRDSLDVFVYRFNWYGLDWLPIVVKEIKRTLWENANLKEMFVWISDLIYNTKCDKIIKCVNPQYRDIISSD